MSAGSMLTFLVAVPICILQKVGFSVDLFSVAVTRWKMLGQCQPLTGNQKYNAEMCLVS